MNTSMVSASTPAIAQLEREVERLRLLAEAEALANASGLTSRKDEHTKALAAARAQLTQVIEQEQIERFARAARMLREARERREEIRAELAAIEAEIATFSEQTISLFRHANDIMRWTDAARFNPANPALGAMIGHSNRRFDALGRSIDASPRDYRGRQVVPDEDWPAVKRCRDAFVLRTGRGEALASADSAVRCLEQQNPALAQIV